MSIWVGIKIWGATIILNALCWLLYSLFTINVEGILTSMLFLLGGMVFTLPLVLLIVPLLYYSCRLPYNRKCKTAWLGFYYMMLIYLTLETFKALLVYVSPEFANGSLLHVIAFLSLVISLKLNQAAILKLDQSVNPEQPVKERY